MNSLSLLTCLTETQLSVAQFLHKEPQVQCHSHLQQRNERAGYVKLKPLFQYSWRQLATSQATGHCLPKTCFLQLLFQTETKVEVIFLFTAQTPGGCHPESQKKMRVSLVYRLDSENVATCVHVTLSLCTSTWIASHGGHQENFC